MNFFCYVKAALFAALLLPFAAAAEKWDMPVAYSASNYHTETGVAFAECVNAASGGDLEIIVHPSGSLFKGNEIKRAVQTGQALIGERLLSAHENENPLFGFDAVPFLATSFADSQILWEAARPVIREVLEKQNLHLLYSVAWPPQGFYFNKEVNSIADMSGVKFRTYNAAGQKMAELAGMQPVQIEAAELSQALATGVAEGLVSSGSTGFDRKVWEHLSHFYRTDAWLPRNYVFVNKDAWDKLSGDMQDAFSGCAALAEYAGYWRAVQYTDFTINGLRENGMQTPLPSEALKSGLRDIGETMTEDWLAAAGSAGEKIVASFKAARE
jgi:TRAP-type C4-dicarboxylate transport system substrate-binding protein